MIITTDSESREIIDTITDLTKSDMIVEFGSFVSDGNKYSNQGDTVFSCKIKSFNKYGGGVTEHAKGFGDSPVEAFTKAYNYMNKIGRYE